MLNLFKLLPRRTKITKHSKINEKSNKHFPSSIREWKDSTYSYNRNNEILTPSASNLTLKLIKSYFNLYNKHLEFRMRTKRLLLRFRRLSSNRFYLSNGGFKHTNNKVSINLYVFNRQKKNYILALKKWFIKRLLTKVTDIKKVVKKKDNFSNKKTWITWKTWKRNRKINLSRFNSSKIRNIRRKKLNINNKIIRRIREINNKGIEKLELLNKNKDLVTKILDIIKKTNKYKINSLKGVNNYTENFYNNLIKKSIRKIRIYFYYKQLILLNNSKLSYTYLQHMRKYLENIYNKNVEFNIVNLKKFYLNSDVLSESISIKLAKNRRKMFRYLTKLKDKVVIKDRKIIAFKPKQNLTTRLDLSNSELLLRKYIINNLKYKHATGFRLEAKGRLSKRFTASRSVSKLKYKGNLLELDSSYRGWSSVLLKGNLRPNTQYTKIKSKSRIGSFGIKGWISGN